ncbi:MAG: hypothetical protein L0Z62_19495 [Gemmataceae bacterium]|nr:hypothetical protein [Gemmataceae bacterium]
MPAPSANPNLKIGFASTTAFRAEDRNDSRFFIEGALDAQGQLSFVVVAELPDGTRGSGSGSEFFDALMDAFGPAVKVIVGAWSATNPAWTTNLDAFNRAVQQGDAEEVAATKTPTGRYATRKGYTNVAIIQLSPTGAKGQYRDVLVHFTQ